MTFCKDNVNRNTLFSLKKKNSKQKPLLLYKAKSRTKAAAAKGYSVQAPAIATLRAASARA